MSNGSSRRRAGGRSDILLAVAVVGIVLLLVIPLPPLLLDALLSISFLLAITTLLVTLYADDPLSFSAFPSLLLFITLFRLSLNIAATRMILSEGHAGGIIKTFGQFVTGGNPIVGIIIFILLTAINFIVITKGAGRVAEVAARFMLDAMPGKQLSVDADLNAGTINEQEATYRREKIATEADFYGAMDGASKFIRGDAVAGILIVIVNILGGFAMGLFVKDMGWEEAVQTYTVLTVGDGLVTQIPALLVSVGAGILITRTSTRHSLGEALQTQLFTNPQVLFVAAGVLLALSFVPGMPMLVMFPIAAAMASYAFILLRQEDQGKPSLTFENPLSNNRAVDPAVSELQEQVEVKVVPLELEVGRGLVALLKEPQEGSLLGRVSAVRRRLAQELGIVIPELCIRDNVALESESYLIKIKGNEVEKGFLPLDSYLAVAGPAVRRPIPGIAATTSSVFGTSAVWISSSQKKAAEKEGYTVVDLLGVLENRLEETFRDHAYELLNRQEVASILEKAKPYASAVIGELVPARLNLGQLLRILQNLLREHIPIRDIVSILEILADRASSTTDPELLTEYVRQDLMRSVAKQYASSDGALHVVTLDTRVEQMMTESLRSDAFGTRLMLRPQTMKKLGEQLQSLVAAAAAPSGRLKVKPVILTQQKLRLHLKKSLEREFPSLPVLSINEVPLVLEIKQLGVISTDVLVG